MAKRKRNPPWRRPASATSPASSRRWQIAACLGIVAAAVCLADGRIVGNDWVAWDDQLTIYENPAFNPPEFTKLLRFWRKPAEHLYIPVTYTYWWLVAEASWTSAGSNAAAFHAGSVVLHILAAWLVLAICERLTGSLAAATAGALLFALHPVQVEPVAWASGAKDLLAGVFCLLAVWLYLLRGDATTDRGRRWRTVAATIAFVLAMFAKPSAVVAPLVLLVVGWLNDRTFSRGLLVTVGVWLMLAVPVILLTRIVQPATGVYVPAIWQRPIVALDVLGFYLRSLVWPARLTFVYCRTPDVQLAWPWTNIAVALAAGLVIGWAGRRWPFLVAAAAIWLAALIPYLGLVPFDYQAKSTVADHYLYLAMLGPAVGLAYALRRSRWPAWVACAGVFVVLAVVSHRQSYIWRDKMTLLDHGAAMNPGAPLPRHAKGIVLAGLNDMAGAEREFRIALKLAPDHADSHTSLAMLLTNQGRHEEALKHYRLAVEATPDNAIRRNNLAGGLVALGRIDEAIEVIRNALAGQDRSGDDLLHANLGRLLMLKGRRAEARVELEKALAINPDLENARRGLDELRTQEPSRSPE